MKMKLRNIVSISASLFFFSAIAVSAPNQETAKDSPFDYEINTPVVPTKAARAVERHIAALSKHFEGEDFDIGFTRNNEVLVVTIPAAKLFRPNETSLIPAAKKILSHFSRAIDHPDSYRLVVAVYADDTGDGEYSRRLTSDRADAIMKVFNDMARKAHISPNITYHYFGSKKDKFLVPNNSIANRAKNRRVEIYIVPLQKTIDAARGNNS